jgi:MoaA/NifB/PqqE/SkfB family radical SAM enzyme
LIPFEPTGRGRKNDKLKLSLDEYIKLCKFIDRIREDNRSKIKILFEEQPEEFAKLKTIEWQNYKRCSAGLYYFSILYNGDIVSCINCDRSSLKVYGNIKIDDMEKIWKNGFNLNRDKNYKFCDNHYYLKLLKRGENENKNKN